MNYTKELGEIHMPKGSPKPFKDHTGKVHKSMGKCAEAWGITYFALRSRLKMKWDLERALTTPVATKVKPKDHLGNEYDTIKLMCKHYDITTKTYEGRLSMGWDLEKTLTTPKYNKQAFYDHEGTEWLNMAVCAKAYGLSRSTLSARLQRDWDLETALTTPTSDQPNPRAIPIVDLNGKIYESKTAYSLENDISTNTLRRREAKGLTGKDFFADPQTGAIECYDHKGNKYDSKKARAEHFGNVESHSIDRRLKRNENLEKALIDPPFEGLKRYRVYDHKGKEYPTMQAMADEYKIRLGTLHNRLKIHKWSLEKSLVTPVRGAVSI